MSQMVMVAPIVRVDRAKRIVEAIATSEAVDSFGTVFSYDASLAAFKRAFGNVREMHQLIAVGRLVKWQGDPQARTIRVWIYVSPGAESTWQKILDGTLRGVSIGADPQEWQNRDGVRWCMRYALVELSLVDQPSNPDALVSAVRVWRSGTMAATRAMRDNDDGDGMGDPIGSEAGAAEGAAAKVKPEQDAWHEVRDTSLNHARAAMTNCGCDECGDMADQLDARQPKETRGRGRGAAAAQAAMLAEVRRAMASQQAALLHAFSGKFAQFASDIDARLALIEAQPVAGGPITAGAQQRASVTPGAGVDLGRYQGQIDTAAQIRALQATAQKTGDPQLQVALAAEIFALQHGGQ
jgi:hypothetical protein